MKCSILWILVITVVILIITNLTQITNSAEYQTGSTTMNVTVRGYVAISASTCLTGGITFGTLDPNTNGNNATCNTNGPSGGTNYNLTVDPSSTVNINFTHSSNRTNLISGGDTIPISNVKYHSSSTSNTDSNLYNYGTAISLSNSWGGLENCGNLGDGQNCWITYFIDIPSSTPPGNYLAGYCWCGRQVGTSESSCGSCT
ncbi:MAG: hypothetical protein QW754_05860 [Thermoplasmata archaeon]